MILLNSFPPGQNGRHFANVIFTWIFVNGKFYILIKISLKFVPVDPIYNNSGSIGLDNGLAPNRWQTIIWTNADPVHWRIYVALVGDELSHCSLSKPCGDIDLGHYDNDSGNGLLPDGTKPLPEPELTYHQACYVVFTWEPDELNL